jgi:putative thioredoxin
MGIDAGRAIDLSGIVSRSTPAAGQPSSRQAPTNATSDNISSQAELMLPGLALQAEEANFSSVLDISKTVPVLVCFVFNLDTDEPMVQVLTDAVTELSGRVVLVSIDATANPQLSASFQVDSISAAEGGATPVVAAVIAGRPLPLFAGTQPADVIAQVLQQLVAVGRENGVAGLVVTPKMVSESDGGAVPVAEPEVTLAPLHQEAFDAIERGDYAAAVRAYERALVENPRDDMARAGLAQVSLIERLQGKSLADVRNAAAANPSDVLAALDVADLDVSGGHIDDAFERLLSAFALADKDDRETIRGRLLQLFDVVGTSDPRVISARGRLAALLY